MAYRVSRSFFAFALIALGAACSGSPKTPAGSMGAAGAGGSSAAGAVGTSGTTGEGAGATGTGSGGTTGGGAGTSSPSGAAGATGAAGSGGAAGTTSVAGHDGGPVSDGGADAATDGGATSAVKGHPTPGATYPTYAGFTLYLVEEFNDPVDLNKDPLWTWGDGTINDGQARFVEDAITFADGKLKITISQGHTDAGFSVVKNGDVPARELKSGELRSKYNMFRYGRYEASIKAPLIDGNFILSMFSFRTPHYQEWREIDWELLGSLPRSVSTNIIIGQNMQSWAATAEEPASVFPFGAQPAMALPAGYGAREAFHTYAFELLPDHVTFFVDGVPIRTKQDKLGANKLIVPERSMKVMFNHWVFNSTGAFGGDPSKNVYPFTGEYDWFRFYKWDQDVTYPCEPVPACLPADDKDLSANNPKEAAAP
jgi:beta-glucanase (GH16 family)